VVARRPLQAREQVVTYLLRRFEPPLQASEYAQLPFLGSGLQLRNLHPTSCQAASANGSSPACVPAFCSSSPAFWKQSQALAAEPAILARNY
jgi:hypothetical protein